MLREFIQGVRMNSVSNTAELRTVEDVYEALQFDPMNVVNIGNRRVAHGIAAMLLKEEFGHKGEYIAALIRCPVKTVAELIAGAKDILGVSSEIKTIVAEIRLKGAQYKKDAEPVQKPQRVRVRPVRPDPKPLRKNARCCLGGNGMEAIARTVAQTTGVSLDVMRGDERGFAESNARTIAMAVSAVDDKRDPKDIAAYFKRLVGDLNFSRARVSTAIRQESNTSLYRSTLEVCQALNIAPESLILKR